MHKYFFWLMVAEETAFRPKASLVTHLFLSDLRVAIEFHYIYTVLLKLWLMHHFFYFFNDSLSQVKFSIMSVIIIF